MKILVSRYKGLGDVLMALVICKGLHLKYRRKIVFATHRNFFPLAERCSFIKRVITEEEAAFTVLDFDLDFHLQDRIDFLPVCTSDHRLNLMARICKLSNGQLRPGFRLRPTSDEYGLAYKILARAGVSRTDFLVGLHLKSAADIRSWTIRKYINLSRKLIGQGCKVVILDNQPIRDRFKDLDVILPSSTNLSTLIGLVASCNLVICPDSGVMHLAGFLSVPFVALFGPINPVMRIKYYDHYRVLFKDRIPCVPCWDWQIRACHGDDYKRCMKAITVNDVLRSANELREEMGNRLCF